MPIVHIRWFQVGAFSTFVLLGACSSESGKALDSGGAPGTGGLAAGGSGTGGRTGSGGSAGMTAMTGTGGNKPDAGLGGAPGSGGKIAGTGGKTASGGKQATGGATGSGGGGTDGGAGKDAAADLVPRLDGKTDLPAQANLPAGVTALFPPPDGQDICPDPVLRISFASPPTLGGTGKITVHNTSGTAVASVDMAASSITDTIGGSSFVVMRPVFVDSNDAVIYLKQKALSYGQTYYVNVESGAVKPPSGTLAITDATTWRFSTAAAKPASTGSLTVALDGSGQFCTVQGALDALPSNSTAASTIAIANGQYHEIIYVSGKSNITLHGQDRKQTVILGTNNNTQQGANASTSNRALMGFRNTNGLTVENLTIHNLTPQGGSQAEALAVQGCDKCVVRDADILSLQDTLLWSGRIYAKNLYVAGNVDFVWGTGAVYFDTCEIKTVGRSGYVVQARNPSSAYGYVFVDSKITADQGITGIVLARIDVSVYPASHVAYVNCQMGSHISPAGWTVTGGSDTSALRFWEYQSVDASGNPVDTSKRSGGTQITTSQAASMRDPSVVLGGWQPPK
jgi:pectin methylesterase-like acyl-CoA thioesterase